MAEVKERKSDRQALLSDATFLSSALPPLLIEADRIAQAVQQGIHGRRRAGAGETFWQFRRYEQGDPAERIDWRQSSRTDKIFIREREWEAAQSAYLWTDNSGSMHYASQSALPTKIHRAQLLMLALSHQLLGGGEKVTWMDQDSLTVFGKTGLERIAAHLCPKPSTANLPPDIRINRNAHIILASDFLMPLDELERKMRIYTARNLRGVLLHILDPQEDSFTFKGRVEVEGCEQEGHLLLPNAAALQKAYLEKIAQHKKHLTEMAQRAGWFYTYHVTTEPPHLALLRLYHYLDAQHQ